MPQDSWTEWSQHVLKELERLNQSYETLRNKIESLQQIMSEMASHQTGVEELKTWKKEMDAVMSPPQLKELEKTVDDLKVFKVKAVTIWAVIQVIIGIVLAILAL